MARSAGQTAAGGVAEQAGEGSLGGRTVTNLQESRVDQLIDRIKPSQQSEERRATVAAHVKALIEKCCRAEHEVLGWRVFCLVARPGF